VSSCDDVRHPTARILYKDTPQKESSLGFHCEFKKTVLSTEFLCRKSVVYFFVVLLLLFIEDIYILREVIFADGKIQNFVGIYIAYLEKSYYLSCENLSLRNINEQTKVE